MDSICKRNESWDITNILLQYIDNKIKWKIFSFAPTNFQWQHLLCPYNEVICLSNNISKLSDALISKIHLNLYCVTDKKHNFDVLPKIEHISVLHLHLECVSLDFIKYFIESKIFTHVEYLAIGACCQPEAFGIAKTIQNLKAFAIEYYMSIKLPICNFDVLYLCQIYRFIFDKMIDNDVCVTHVIRTSAERNFNKNKKFRFWIHNGNISFDKKYYQTFACGAKLTEFYKTIEYIANFNGINNIYDNKFEIHESRHMYNTYVKREMYKNHMKHIFSDNLVIRCGN
uniref:Uncharacterized protein n=1 Tax=Nesodiprion zhejiangensis nucleopolyhedrovirus TaxID=3135970 RepID=A0AAN0LHL9_9BACU